MNETRMMDFVGRAVEDVGALLGGAMVVIGDQLGLYRAMAGSGPLTAAEIAEHTGTVERYVREWLSAQAARGYVTYDGDGRFLLPDEHAIPLTDETSPACVIGAFEIAVGSVYATDAIADRFRTGEGLAWGAHHDHVRGGCERFFRPGYLSPSRQLVDPGPRRRRGQARDGARVADVGCGHGASTVLIAQAFPRSTLHRFRLPRAVDRGRPETRAPKRASPTDAPSRSPPPRASQASYDLICFFDCLHDMGDPSAPAHTPAEHLRPAARSARRAVCKRRPVETT